MKRKWMESGFMLIQQVAHLVKYQAMREMESFHLKPNQVGIMFILGSEGELSQRELAKLIGITPPSMTVALRKLEKQGYVQRKVDEKDQRIQRITITDQGADCLNELKETMHMLEAGLYEGISEEERKELQRIMLRMRTNMLNYKEIQGMDMCSIMEERHL